MDFYLDRGSNQLVRSSGLNAAVNAVTFKARDRVRIDAYFSRAAVAEDLEPDSLLVLAIKTGYQDAATTLALVTDWDLVDEGTGHYRAYLNLNTEALGTAIGDLASITAVGELTWSEDDGDNWESSNTLTVTILNDVYKGVEGTPQELPTPTEWLAIQNAAIREALGIPTYADLAAANAALSIGMIYYDEDLETLNTATA